MEKLIFHVDVNSAFLSWEAVRRMANGEEDIRLIPSAIGGDREKRTGVILTKSIPAKNFGIKTGEPVGMALRKCPNLFLARPDFRLYEENSRKFMAICREFTPVVEKYSIDECFMDMTGSGIMFPDPVKAAYQLKDRIRKELGFTVNVGISDVKILAKMAGDFEKPDKVHTLFRHEIQQKMWPLSVQNLISVGTSTAEKLVKAKIRTIGELATSDVKRVQRIVGMKLGQNIWNYANGVDDSAVLSESETVKGYSNSTTLEKNITKADHAHKVLLELADSVACRMRSDGMKAFCVAVTIRSANFQEHSHQRTLCNPTDITKEIYQISKELFSELWDGYTPLRLLGISLSDLTRNDIPQMTFFAEDERREKARKLDKAYDAINHKFGSSTILRGSSIHSDLSIGKKHRAQMELQTKSEKEKKS